ncbi:thiosulfate oxidation carrier complex protein SoxZ [Pseudoroseicyclus tamaricis]|uniref:Thiosulfate oxidation carrier complex protein SoxZ n=1 Tax=Pseudoroseicyclus tamaricis TaxID=2705421 RepID=A0A6B2K2J7_9RHOB|nr:thiosulfate oxidation carrier complex protein SoxZ [Pseudoroseicyclus tamaricis]NDV00686.1 thiosulfate oxidation carrier complex protein SoxZ [Pseudoroseicyclus tamaricis]
MAVMINVPETAAPGEVVEVKIIISHPMETGFRTGSDGKLVPRNIIHELTCRYMGQEVFRAELHPAVAANPFFSFFVTAQESGEVELSWVDEAGETVTETRPIEVG